MQLEFIEVPLPQRLCDEIDQLVGRENRSLFAQQIVENALLKRKQENEIIRDFPTKASENLKLGRELLRLLHLRFEDTKTRPEWSARNFAVLNEFAELYGAKSYPFGMGKNRRPQMLWDYIAHRKEGLLLVAESEHNREQRGLKHDFEKLLYARAPLKLMLTRIHKETEAEQQKNELQAYMKECCTRFSPGEVYLLYCVWWAQDGKTNADVSYIMQIPGESAECAIGGAEFGYFDGVRTVP